MKKFLVILLILVLSMAIFTGCDSEGGGDVVVTNVEYTDDGVPIVKYEDITKFFHKVAINEDNWKDIMTIEKAEDEGGNYIYYKRNAGYFTVGEDILKFTIKNEKVDITLSFEFRGWNGDSGIYQNLWQAKGTWDDGTPFTADNYQYQNNGDKIKHIDANLVEQYALDKNNYKLTSYSGYYYYSTLPEAYGTHYVVQLDEYGSTCEAGQGNYWWIACCEAFDAE